MTPPSLRSKAPVRKYLVGGLKVSAALYLLVCIGCASFQRRMIYFPPVLTSQQVEQTAQSQRLELWRAPDGRAVGCKRLSPVRPAQGQLLILHGNAGCAVFCGQYADRIQQAAPLDVFMLEYPGYADRPGKPTERTLDESADEAFLLLATNGPVYLVGESLGTGVAAYLAGRYPDKVGGLIMLAPFNRLSAVAQAHMRILPVSLLLCDRFPAADNLCTYPGPLAVLVAGHDTVIPARFGRRLYDGFAGPKRLWEFPEGNHGTVMVQPVEVWKEILDFCRRNKPL